MPSQAVLLPRRHTGHGCLHKLIGIARSTFNCRRSAVLLALLRISVPCVSLLQIFLPLSCILNLCCHSSARELSACFDPEVLHQPRLKRLSQECPPYRRTPYRNEKPGRAHL